MRLTCDRIAGLEAEGETIVTGFDMYCACRPLPDGGAR
jgi:hypothetical protein